MKIRRRCKCGCGGITNPGKKYIHGHNRRVIKIRRRCKCGCNGITNPGKMYISGHNRRGATVIVSEENKRDRSLRMKINNPMKNPEIAAKVSLIRKKKYGGVNHPRYGIRLNDKIKNKLSISMIEHWQDPSFQKKQYEARAIKPNKPEIKLGEILNKFYPNEYKYVGDFQFWLGGKNPDFMNINGQKKLVELFGDYWHKGQDPQDRINHFKQYGFNTLVIWENELKKNRLQLRRRLKEFHGS